MGTFVRKYIYGRKFEYMTQEEAEQLREECHKEMEEVAPAGTPKEIVFEMGEYLYNMQLRPKA